MESTPISTTKTPDTDTDDTETPSQIHLPKPISAHNRRRGQPAPAGLYKECLKNHAASLGGLALDGCGEFMPFSSGADLNCAACGCHRNFHRREGIDRSLTLGPPFPQSYFASGPQMLLALSAGGYSPAGECQPDSGSPAVKRENPDGRKRFRTKFSSEQRKKMCLFAEKMGWKMKGNDEKIVEEFCKEVDVGKNVLKIWMHNNKHKIRGSNSISNVNGSSSYSS